MSKINKNEITQALNKLTQDAMAGNGVTVSETARLRPIFDQIESTLSAGISREAVLKTLHEQGFSMTLASFKSALQRIRKERNK